MSDRISAVDRDGNPVDISSPEEARQRWEAGEIGFTGDRIPVVQSDGTVGHIPNDPEVLRQTFGSRGMLATQGQVTAAEERARIRRERESVAGRTQTAVEALERGYTAGLSDVVRTSDNPLIANLPITGVGSAMGIAEDQAAGGQRSGEDRAQAMLERQEANPGTAIAGEVGGAVLGAAAGPRLSPAGLLARGGRAAEGAVARVAGQGLAGRTAARAAGGAVEGAGWGVGMELSEAALENRELTADGLAASMGMHAVLGGVGGGGLGLAGDAVGAGVRRVGAGAARLGREGQAAVGRMFERQTGNTLRDGVAEAYARMASTATGQPTGQIRRFVELSPQGRRVRQLVTDQDAVFEVATREGRELMDQASRAARDVFDESVGTFKASQVARAARSGDANAAVVDAVERLRVIGAQADEMLADSATWGARAATNRVRSQVDTMRSRIDEIVAGGGDDAAARVFMELDQFKRAIGRDSRPGRFIQQSNDADAVARIRTWYESMRQHLESAELYGGAASMQRDVNAAWTGYLSSMRKYNQTFMERTGQEGFNPVFSHSPAKLEGFLRNIGRARNDIGEETLAHHNRAQQDLLDAINKHMDLSPQARGSFSEARRNARRMDRWLGRAREDVATINQFRELSGAAQESSQLLAPGVGAAVGGMVAGPAGAAVGGTSAALAARPDQVVRGLAAIERIMGNLDGKVQKSVAKWLRGARETAGRRVTRVATGVRRSSPAATASLFRERSQQINDLASHPEMLEERSQRSTDEVRGVAPGVAEQMRMNHGRAVRYLRAQLPRGAATPLAGDQRLPSTTEMRKWHRMYEAAQNPMAVVDAIENGTVTAEQVDVVRELHPALYQRIRTELLNQIMAAERPPPYQERIRLGLLFDIPTTPSLEPAAIAARQAGYAYTAPEPGQPPASETSRPAPDIAGAFMTETERVASRRQ